MPARPSLPQVHHILAALPYGKAGHARVTLTATTACQVRTVTPKPTHIGSAALRLVGSQGWSEPALRFGKAGDGFPPPTARGQALLGNDDYVVQVVGPAMPVWAAGRGQIHISVRLGGGTPASRILSAGRFIQTLSAFGVERRRLGRSCLRTDLGFAGAYSQIYLPYASGTSPDIQ